MVFVPFALDALKHGRFEKRYFAIKVSARMNYAILKSLAATIISLQIKRETNRERNSIDQKKTTRMVPSSA